jgi:hypothetical protein
LLGTCWGFKGREEERGRVVGIGARQKRRHASCMFSLEKTTKPERRWTRSALFGPEEENKAFRLHGI